MNEATFAQPSGLAIDGNTLYVADAESNTIRAVQLPPINTVTTIAGGDLFEFGDKDGKGDSVRLQHPLGVAAQDGRVFIADTYNHKIKMLDPATGKLSSTLGDGLRRAGRAVDRRQHAVRRRHEQSRDSNGRSLNAKGRDAHDSRFDAAGHMELPSPPMTAAPDRVRARCSAACCRRRAGRRRRLNQARCWSR